MRPRDIHAGSVVTIPIVVTSLFLFRPRPTHHATARSIHARRGLHVLGAVYSVWARAAPAASPFLQTVVVKAALQSRKNGAATARPPSHVGSFLAAARFPRTHAVTAVAAGLVRPPARAARATAAPAAPGRVGSRVACGPVLQLTQRRNTAA